MVKKPYIAETLVDAVVRTHFYKYFHPKEALISNGVLNRYDCHFVINL